MFEKEAEEYLKTDGTKAEQILNMLNEISPLKIKIKQLPFVLAMLLQVWQDGAEFGYNKANEWHYVKDGDLPDTECSVLIYCIGGYRIERYYKDKKFFGEFSLNFVHGWQYLPDYIETAKGE